MDLNRTPSAIAFCATAPGVRFNFFAVAEPDNLALANARNIFTSSRDHATTTRFFDFAIIVSSYKRCVS
jgi:hypothetical protein